MPSHPWPEQDLSLVINYWHSMTDMDGIFIYLHDFKRTKEQFTYLKMCVWIITNPARHAWQPHFSLSGILLYASCCTHMSSQNQHFNVWHLQMDLNSHVPEFWNRDSQLWCFARSWFRYAFTHWFWAAGAGHTWIIEVPLEVFQWLKKIMH